MPPEIVANIMVYVVKVGRQFPRVALERIFGTAFLDNQKRTGSIVAARTSDALHKAALAMLFNNDVILFDGGDFSSPRVPKWALSGYLIYHVGNPESKFLRHVRHMELRNAYTYSADKSRDTQLVETFFAISHIKTVCPNLKSVEVHASAVLKLLRQEWYGGAVLCEDDRKTTKKDIILIVGKLHELRIPHTVLDLGCWPMSKWGDFKIDCTASDCQKVAIEVYDELYGPRAPMSDFKARKKAEWGPNVGPASGSDPK